MREKSNPIKKFISHRQRLEVCLAGEKPDRVPVALWRHFPVDDQSPGTLAAAVIAFQDQFDFDLVKVTPASSFCLKDWGIQDIWKGNPEGTREYTSPIIQSSEDWAKLKPLNPNQGFLADQVTCLSTICKYYKPKQVPVLQTIFSPISQAKNLVGKANLVDHIHHHQDIFLHGLRTITDSILSFVEACKKSQPDGFFYAMQYAQSDFVSKEEFQRFFRPFDLEIYASIQEYWLNMGHLHGDHVLFEEIKEYSFPILNWHDRLTPPDLPTAKTIYPGVVCGGLKQWESLVFGDSTRITLEAEEAIKSTEGKRFILSTGCVTPVIAPYGNILAARKAVDKE
jgi:uroporphyrinogen decarboxylase